MPSRMLRRFRFVPPWQVVAFALLAVVLTLIYRRAFEAPFLPWDDDYNLTKNPYIAVSGWRHLWVESFYGMYVPVTGTVWAALYDLSDGKPWPFRPVNLAFHFTNTFLVYVLLSSLLRKLRTPSALAAFAGAALFALHPLQVGSVAWISDLRGIMSTFFGLLATLVFFRWRGWAGAAGGLALFALGLLSKPQIAVLPLALSGAVFLLEREFLMGALLRLAPWFASSAAVALITHDAQKAVVEWQTPFWMRPIVMMDSYGFYVLKTFFPYPLAVDYGRTPGFLQENLERAAGTLVAGVTVAIACAWLVRRDRKWALGSIWFMLLLQTSGVLDFGFQQISTVTDHYNYAPLIVVAAVFAMAMQPLFESARWRREAVGGALALFTGLAVVSFERAGAWSGESEFFQDMIAKNPGSYSGLIGLTNIECMSSDRRRIEDGLEHARRATEVRPQDPVSVADLAVCLIRLERFTETLALEEHLHNPDFVRRLKRHDFATSSLLMSLGGVAFYLGQVDKGFVYACEGAASNAMSAAGSRQIADFKRQLAARGDIRQCPPRAGLEGVIAVVDSIPANARMPGGR